MAPGQGSNGRSPILHGCGIDVDWFSVASLLVLSHMVLVDVMHHAEGTDLDLEGFGMVGTGLVSQLVFSTFFEMTLESGTILNDMCRIIGTLELVKVAGRLEARHLGKSH